MIIIDVEIKKAILGRNDLPIPGIEYCGGWRDFEGMGIACVCTYDINTGLSRVFCFDDEDQKYAFENYISGKRTAGFNTRRFDNTLLHHHGVDVEKIGGEHYDILEEIWVALGLNPDKFNPKTHGGWGLDAVCQATLGIAKTGNGALAPIWWQQGKRGKVIDYCLNDCNIEGRLLQWIIDGNPVRNASGSVLRVAGRFGTRAGQIIWACVCKCGERVNVQGGNLKNGVSTSCGCLQREGARERFTTHGESKTRLYKAWQGMHQRCTNSKHRGYVNYGGRGIKVCARWSGSDGFQNFVEDMGRRPRDMTLDRYPDAAGDYSPENCRWATYAQQAATKRLPPHMRPKLGSRRHPIRIIR
jgi:hypothetical protein